MPAVAKFGDANTHGGGVLLCALAPTVFVNGVVIAVLGDPSTPDSLCPVPGGPHCAPAASSGSGTVFAGGKPVHRGGDLRTCGATTIATSPNVNAG